MSEQLIIVKTSAQLQQLQSYINDFEYVAFDTETNGVDKESTIIGFSVCAEVDKAYYVVLSYWDKDLQQLVDLPTKHYAKQFLSSLTSKKLIMHNGVFDCAMVYNNYKANLINSLHTDTMVLGHLLNENRSNGLKELATAIYGEDARVEQTEMKESVIKNGGMLTKEKYELYKADADLIAKYGAKDAILTLRLMYELIPQLYEEGLDKFFYENETMPLLRGPTYELNTSGLAIDPIKLQNLRGTLESQCMEAKAFIYKEITPLIQDKYKGTNKNNTFNVSAPKQLSWLLFDKLGNEFNTLTESGREVCKFLGVKGPYAPKDKKEFIRQCAENKGLIYAQEKWNTKTGKMSRAKKIADYWTYLQCGKETLTKLQNQYKFVAKYLEYCKDMKLLSTYVLGIQSRMKYNIIHPNFLQHGTTSGRYSCKNPNFTNLPRDDKRIKSCVIARPGKVFVGADYSQLEPRVFASISQDPTLLDCFKKGQDFYSVVGMPIFNKIHLSAYKKDPNSFAEKHPELRNIAKAFALATPYGTSAFQQSMKLGKSRDECQEIIDRYFEAYPKVELMMLQSHEEAKKTGVVYNLYGRPRRIPEAKHIPKIYGTAAHNELPYEARTLLNLAMNHKCQSTAASITNRAMIKFHKDIKDIGITNCNLSIMVHDEIVVECKREDAEDVSAVLKNAMEHAVELPGVDLIAEPKIGNNLSELK